MEEREGEELERKENAKGAEKERNEAHEEHKKKKKKDDASEELKKLLEEKDANIKSLQDKVLYLQADFENFKRLKAKEKLDTLKYGNEVLLNQGTIYASLVRLQQRGWISAEWGTSDNNRKAKFYSITKPGRKQLSEDAAYWQRLSLLMNRVLALPEQEDKS